MGRMGWRKSSNFAKQIRHFSDRKNKKLEYDQSKQKCKFGLEGKVWGLAGGKVIQLIKDFIIEFKTPL